MYCTTHSQAASPDISLVSIRYISQTYPTYLCPIPNISRNVISGTYLKLISNIYCTSQVAKIHDVLGTPSQSTLDKLRKYKSRSLDFNFPYKRGKKLGRNCCSPFKVPNFKGIPRIKPHTSYIFNNQKSHDLDTMSIVLPDER